MLRIALLLYRIWASTRRDLVYLKLMIDKGHQIKLTLLLLTKWDFSEYKYTPDKTLIHSSFTSP